MRRSSRGSLTLISTVRFFDLSIQALNKPHPYPYRYIISLCERESTIVHQYEDLLKEYFLVPGVAYLIRQAKKTPPPGAV